MKPQSRKGVSRLARFRDSVSYHYVERCVVEQSHFSIAVFDKTGKTVIPSANLSLLLLGPGTRITHAAVRTLMDCGCLIYWVGEQGIRCYASAQGKTRGASRLIHQAALVSDPTARLKVVRRMYEMRFGEKLSAELQLAQIRGKEGARLRACYQRWAKDTGVEWISRDYSRTDWDSGNPVNRALSAANACLYGICHAAILASGYSPALGFIHCGKMLSFVYDIADLYKTETTIPAAFSVAAESAGQVDSRVRVRMRELIYSQKLLQKIIPDIHSLLGYGRSGVESEYDAPDDPPGKLWDPDGEVEGGVNYEEEDDVDGRSDSGDGADGVER